MVFYKDEGIILKKTKLLKGKKLIHIFTKTKGKLILTYHGSSSIKSRRISHLETMNLIKFSSRISKGYFTLQETEVVLPFEYIKSNEFLLKKIYEVLGVLNSILPEQAPEESIYIKTKGLFLKLNKIYEKNLIESYYRYLLLELGYTDEKTVNNPNLDINTILENILNKKITKY